MLKQQLAEELYKPIIRKFEKQKVYSSFEDNIWCADLADMELSKYNEGFRFLSCVIVAYSKDEWVVPLKVKMSNTYIDFALEIYKKDPKFEVGDHVRISKYKTFLQKTMLQIGLKKFL